MNNNLTTEKNKDISEDNNVNSNKDINEDINKNVINTLTNKKLKKDAKDENIPNSLTIYIKTRLPNFYKLTYEPFFTVPKNKSHTVYFDPFIKYYSGPIKSLPSNSPKDALYTQFFEAAEFDSMVNRILSGFVTMQKQKTFKESIEDHIIDNNIKITLDTLFKTNNIIYINKDPYTIVSSNWTESDWKIDKKPLEKLLAQFPTMTLSQLDEDARKQLDDIPEPLRQGSISAGIDNLAKGIRENDNILNDYLQNEQTTKSLLTSTANLNTNSFIEIEDISDTNNTNATNFLNEYLRENFPINNNNVFDYRDPLTLNLLIITAELIKYINQSQNDELKIALSSYIDTKQKLIEANERFKTAFSKAYGHVSGEIYKQLKKTYKNLIEEFKQSNDVKEKNNIINNIINYKTTRYANVFKMIDEIKNIYDIQLKYFFNTKLLLEEIQKQYINIINYYKKPELAMKCIEYDIRLLDELYNHATEQNSDHIKFNNFYLKMNKKREFMLNPTINYADEYYYLDNINILDIEKFQGEVYVCETAFYYFKNQYYIWRKLFVSLKEFTTDIGKKATYILNNAETNATNYNKLYNASSNNLNVIGENFMQRIKAESINYETTKLYFIKEDGSKCIEPTISKINKNKQLTMPNGKQKEDDLKEERDLISVMQSQMDSYDATVLYIYLLETLYLRQKGMFVAKQNLAQTEIENNAAMKQYYVNVEKVLTDKNTNGKIPESFLWDNPTLDNDNINKQINLRNIFYDKQKVEIKVLKNKQIKIEQNVLKILTMITPNLSSNAFVENCEKIFVSDYVKIPDYNVILSDLFTYYMYHAKNDAKIDNIIDNNDNNTYLNCVLYDNSINANNKTDGFFLHNDDNGNVNGNVVDSTEILSVYETVSKALNIYLEMNNLETTNDFVENVDGEKLFTVNSLKKMVFNNNGNANIDKPNEIIELLETALEINIISFEMYDRDNKDILIRDIVRFKENKKYENNKYRVIDIKDNACKLLLYNDFKHKSEYKRHKSTLIENIDINELELTKTNINSNFRVHCGEQKTYMKYDNVMFLVITKDETNQKIYRLVSYDENIIMELKDVPQFIQYLIYNSNCNNKKYDNLFSDKFSYLNKQLEKQLEKQLNNTSNTNNLIKLNKTLLRQKRKEVFKQNSNQKGGENQLIPMYNPQTQMYNPQTQMYYPQSQMYYPQSQMYNYSRHIPYNVSQNKAKDAKSKTSFYITVELELFPGTSANMFQKSIVKCQSTFERIREAYAEIRGFEYRPETMNEGLYYKQLENIKKANEKNKNMKKGGFKQKTLRRVRGTGTRKIKIS